MEKKITVRPAAVEDAAGIAIVRAYTWATAYHGLMPDSVLEKRIESVPSAAGRMKSLIESGALSYAVAVADHTVIGFVSWGKSRDERYPDDGEIGALYVLKGYNGMGAGKALFDFAKEDLVQNGYDNMIINCLEGNPSTDFYRHMGGKIVAQRKDEIAGGHIITENVLRFELKY
ncbi:MAG: GNAT family N-acetyltransferase [Oscillospiraceae bacterium]|nr:GNAT family N-acetyltransferase [Oscillospiraceae bacterium]